MDEGTPGLLTFISRQRVEISETPAVVAGSVRVKRLSKNLFSVAKRDHTNDQELFSFTIREDQLGRKKIWWPIEYRAHDGEVIQSETIINDRLMVNMQKQNILNQLAEKWAKTLNAEVTSRKLRDGHANATI